MSLFGLPNRTVTFEIFFLNAIQIRYNYNFSTCTVVLRRHSSVTIRNEACVVHAYSHAEAVRNEALYFHDFAITEAVRNEASLCAAGGRT